MKQEKLFAVALSALIIGCSGKNGGSVTQGVQKDSLKTADSTVQAPVVQAERLLTYEERQGKHLYQKYCVVCHGQEGKGDGFNAFNLDPHPRDFSDAGYMSALSDKQIYQTISGGGRSVNRSPLMPAYGGTLKKEDIQYLAYYVRTFGGQK
jgi:mono/diheme cytochrome c family protein